MIRVELRIRKYVLRTSSSNIIEYNLIHARRQRLLYNKQCTRYCDGLLPGVYYFITFRIRSRFALKKNLTKKQWPFVTRSYRRPVHFVLLLLLLLLLRSRAILLYIRSAANRTSNIFRPAVCCVNSFVRAHPLTRFRRARGRSAYHTQSYAFHLVSLICRPVSHDRCPAGYAPAASSSSSSSCQQQQMPVVK